MGLSRRWIVESKQFETIVKDDSTGVKIQERCRGQLHFIRQNSLESTWMLNIFDKLVVAKDSSVYWARSIPGLPSILAQHCFNKHGSFLVIEEYDGRERRGFVLISEGRQGKGWDRFIFELRIAINFYQPWSYILNLFGVD
jgi:hypothetical protein